MGELIDWMEEEFGVDTVNAGVSLIYSRLLQSETMQAGCPTTMRVEQLVESISNKKSPANCRFLSAGSLREERRR